MPRLVVEELSRSRLHATSFGARLQRLASTCSIRFGSAAAAAPWAAGRPARSSPISAIAAFTGIGIRFDEDDVHQRQVAALDLARSGEIAVRPAWTSCVISFGITFEATEIMPRPPSAISGSVMDVVAGEHREIVGGPGADVRHLRDVAGGFLHADDVLDRGQALQRGGLDVHAGAALHAVDDDRAVWTAAAIAW